MSVTGHLVRPTQGSNEAGRLLPFYLVLLRVGFTKLPPSPAVLVSSYLTFSPLPSAIARGLGGVFSVALSLESLPLGVTQHPAPWSSDFPRTSVGAPAIVCPARPRFSFLIINPIGPACKPTGLVLEPRPVARVLSAIRARCVVGPSREHATVLPPSRRARCWPVCRRRCFRPAGRARR